MDSSVHGRYLRVLVYTVLATCVVTAMFNRAVNPYCLFATDWLRSRDKPETFTHLRMVKAAQTRHLKPRALILGSSRAETGLDPAHPGWKAHPVYNLGLSNAGIYEIRRYFEHACALGDIRQAVLLLDFTAFLEGGSTAPDFLEARLAIKPDGRPEAAGTWCDLPAGLLSWSALNGSLATLWGRAGEKRYLPDGSRDAVSEDDRILAKGGAQKAFAAYEAKVLDGSNHSNAKISEQEMAHLKAILSLARSKKIDLKLAVAPMHVRYLAILYFRGQWDVYQSWKYSLARLVFEEAGPSMPFSLRDFGVCSSQTADPVPATGLAHFYYEASHFNKVLGNKLLDITLSHSAEPNDPALPGTFGHELTPDTLTTHLKAIDQTFRSYLVEHANEFAHLKSMVSHSSPDKLR